MGKFNLNGKTVEINTEIKFVLRRYLQALHQSGLINYESTETNEKYTVIEGFYFDPCLLPSAPKTGEGFVKQAKHKAETLFSMAVGGRYITLSPMECDIDDDLNDLYEKYVETWTGLLIKEGHYEEKKIIGETITKPHIFISHLIKRFLAFTLEESNLIRINHDKYLHALNHFINIVVTPADSPFREAQLYDFMGAFLLEEHLGFLSSFKSILKSRRELDSHKISLKDAHDLIGDVKKIILRQIIIYWDYDTEEAKLATDCLGHTITTVEQQQLAGIKSLKGSQKQATRQELIAYLSSLPANNKKIPYAFQLKRLYKTLENTQDIKSAIQNIQSLIKRLGWLPLLDGYLKVNNLAEHLKLFIGDIKDQLDTTKHGLPKKSNGHHALLTFRSGGIWDAYNAVANISTALYQLHNKDLHELVKLKIKSDAQGLFNLQKKTGIQFIAQPTYFENAANPLSENLLNREINLSAEQHPLLSQEKHEDKKEKTKKTNIKKFVRNTEKKIKERVVKSSYERKASKERHRQKELINFLDDITEESSLASETEYSESHSNLPPPIFISSTFPINQNQAESSSAPQTPPTAQPSLTAEKLREWMNLFQDACEVLQGKEYDKLTELIFTWVNCLDLDKDCSEKNKLKIGLNKFKYQGETLLHYAIREKLKEQVNWLMNQGASVLVLNDTEETPLTLAARLIYSPQKEIYFSCCEKAQEETAPDLSPLENYQLLYDLCNEAVTMLYQGLLHYNQTQKARMESWSYTFWQNLTWMFGRDFTEQRALEVADAYKYLADIRDNQNYELLKKQLESKLLNLGCSRGIFYEMLKAVVGELRKKLQDKNQYEIERTLYFNSHYNFFQSTSPEMLAFKRQFEEQRQRDKEQAEMLRQSDKEQGEMLRQRDKEQAESEKQKEREQMEAERQREREQAEMLRQKDKEQGEKEKLEVKARLKASEASNQELKMSNLELKEQFKALEALVTAHFSVNTPKPF